VLVLLAADEAVGLAFLWRSQPPCDFWVVSSLKHNSFSELTMTPTEIINSARALSLRSDAFVNQAMKVIETMTPRERSLFLDRIEAIHGAITALRMETTEVSE
jgi:hypothetical protein